MGKKSRRKKSRTAPKAPGAAPRPVEKEALAEGRAIPLWVAIVVLAVLPPVIYFNSLNNAFHYDDIHSLVHNPHIRKLENIPSFFTSSRTASLYAERGHYRPVLFSTYALSYALGGYDNDPKVFRLANLILHILNGLLIFAVFRRASGKTAVAFFTALLFAVHPLNTESVNYISCRSNVLATTFYLAGVWLFVGYAGSAMMRRRAALYAGSLGCFGLGLLTKEIVITLPAILVLLDILLLNPDAKPFAYKALFRRHAAFWMVAGLHLFLIFAVGLKPMYERRGALSNLIIQTKAMVFYLRLLVFPRGLSVSHVFDTKGLMNLSFVVSLLIVVVGLFLAWKLRRRCGLLSFAILWYFITLLPTTSVLSLQVPVNEHRTYLPGIGFAVAVAFLLELARGMSGPTPKKAGEARTRLRLTPTSPRHIGAGRGQALSKLAMPLFVVVIGIFCVAVYARNQAWKTTVTLWEDTVRKYPYNIHAHQSLGQEYYKAGDSEKAEREFLFAIRHGGASRNLVESHNGLGVIYVDRQEYESAAKHFTLSVELSPSAWYPNYNLGIVYVAQGHNEKALKHLQKAVELNPHDERPHRYLALAYLALGKIDEAKGVLQEMKELGLSVPEDLRKRLETAMENP